MKIPENNICCINTIGGVDYSNMICNHLPLINIRIIVITTILSCSRV